MPACSQELAEEIGARLTVLAIRTHVPRRGCPRPPVTLRQRHALRVLARAGGSLTVSRLARAICVGVPAASQLATRMAARGLVERQVGGPRRRDRRRCKVVLLRRGWVHVPRDEKRPDDRYAGMVIGDDFGPEPEVYPSWPAGLRRVTQPLSPIEEGLRCRAVKRKALLAGLRGVLATLHRFDYPAWEFAFECAVAARRRVPRSRFEDRCHIAVLPQPGYQRQR